MRIPYLAILFILTFHLIRAQQPASPSDKPLNQNTFLIKPDFDETSLEGNVYLYSTVDSNVTIMDIIEQKPGFKLINQEIPDLGTDNRYHWLRFRLRNDTPADQQLVSYLHSNELTDVCFYVVNDSNQVVYKKEHLSSETFVINKPIQTEYFAFPVSMTPHKNLIVYWRVKRDHGQLVLPLRLYSNKSFFHFSFRYDFFAYLSYGILAFTFLLSGSLFFITKHKLLYYYAGYCFFYLLLCLSNEGMLKQYFQFELPLIGNNPRMLLSAILIYYIMVFSVNFLQVPSYAPKWFIKFTTTLSYGAIVLILCTLLFPNSAVLGTVLSITILFFLVVVFIMILYGMINKKREAYVYFVAIFLFFTNSIWLMLIALFHVKATWWYYQTILYQTIAEFSILGLELGYGLISDRNNYLQRLNILQRNFTTSILGTQDSERERIAADLHDDLGGTIATIRRRITDIKLRLGNHEVIKEFDELEPLIKKSSEDLRRISHNLMPPEFARIGLANSLQELVQAIPKEPTRFEFLTAGTENKLGTDTELNIYRIVSELVQNIFKHAQAERAVVQLLYYDDHLQVLVEDDGIGNKTVKSEISTSGIGLKNSILRANYIGAELRREISEAGTLVILDVPYSSTTHDRISPD